LEALLALRTLAVPSPALFTYVAVRHTLLAAGVDDRELADYLAALILEFGDHDRHTRIRRADDQTYGYLVDMIGELTGVDDTGERGFLLRVHLGNYSLWLAGLFPDYVEARQSPGRTGLAVLRRARPPGLPARRRAPPGGALRRRWNLPHGGAAVPHPPGRLQPAERSGVVPARLDAREAAAPSVTGRARSMRPYPVCPRRASLIQ